MNEAEIVLTIVGTGVIGGLFIGAMAVVLSYRERVLKLKSQGGPSDTVVTEVEDLRHEVAQLREELSDTVERVDFAERMLSKQRHEQLPP